MIKRFLRDETGLELSEYAIAAAIVSFVAVTAFQFLGEVVSAEIADLRDKVNTP